MKDIIKRRIEFLFLLTAFMVGCQNDTLDAPEMEHPNISRSSVLSSDTVVSISAPNDYYWVENEKMPLQKIEGKYFVMYDDSSIETVATAIRLDGITVHETLGPVEDNQSAYSNDYSLNREKLRTITIQGNPEIETTLLSKVYYWAPYYRMENGNEVRVGNQFGVKLKSEKDFNLLKKYAEKNAVEIVKKYDFLERWYQLVCTQNSKLNAIEMANLFHECGLFEYACPDLIGIGKSANINEPLYQSGNLWHLDYRCGINYIESRKIITHGSSDVVVAIIDGGVDVNHSDFDATMLSGWDATTNTTPNRISNSHGTWVAGFIGAVPNNGKDVAGIGYGCTILPVSIKETESGGILVDIQTMVAAINYAVEYGAKVINCSWEYWDKRIGETIKTALDKGCVVVFSAGNNENAQIAYPANCDSRILVVGATDKNCKRADFSNYGSSLDVMAPGKDVYTLSRGGGVAMVSGTSFAAPQVAGLAAMLLSKYPDESADDVRYRIRKTARKVGQGYRYRYASPSALGSWNDEMGYGLIDAYAALAPEMPYRYIIRVKNSSNYQPMIATRVEIWNTDYSMADVTLEDEFKVLYSGEELIAFCDLLPGNYIINVYPENAGHLDIDFEIKAEKGGEISFEFVGSQASEYRWETPIYKPN
ncbi:MAG: S8 family serine peptidase [Duncaniella sp.]|nr:S8 family serine peptidase [Duncaniella sp.]